VDPDAENQRTRAITTLSVVELLGLTVLGGIIGWASFMGTGSTPAMLALTVIVYGSVVVSARRLRARRLLAQERHEEVFEAFPQHPWLSPGVGRLTGLAVFLVLVPTLTLVGVQGDGWLVEGMGANWWLALALELPWVTEADARLGIHHQRSRRASDVPRNP